MSHYRRDVVGRGISTGLGLGLRRRLSGGALPVLFGWNSETAQALPATSTFTRASIAQVLTTTDGTTNWYQEAKSGEVRLDGMRRVENEMTADDLDSWLNLNGGATKLGNVVTFPGVSAGESIDFVRVLTPVNQRFGVRITASVSSGTATVRLRAILGASGNQDIDLTTTPQTFFSSVTGTQGGNSICRIENTGAGGPYAVDITVEDTMMSFMQTGATNRPDEFVQATSTFNAEVNGVRYFNTANGNSADGNGVVTEATGTTITGGGYLPEPAATNQLATVDLTAGNWSKTNCSITDNGVNSLGLNEYEIDAGTSTGGHRVQINAAVGSSGSSYCTLKEGTGRYAVIRRSGSGSWACFDLQAGTITDTGGSGTLVSDIEDLGDGWYKCLVGTGETSSTYLISISDTDTPGTATPSFTGADETILYCHSQYESTAFSTSPIITSGSTVTRVADVLTGPSASTGHSALMDVTVANFIDSSIARATMIGYSDDIDNRFTTNGTNGVILFTDTGISITVSMASDIVSERHKWAYSIDDNNSIVVDDEGNSGTDLAGTGGSGVIYIGSRGGSTEFFRGRMNNVTVYSVTQTQAQLEALVA